MKIFGTEVKDANEKLVVHITKSDVKLGATKDATACAAARALCRQTGATEAKVHFSRAYIKRGGGKWLRFSVPSALRNEIMAFDRGGEFAPGEYLLSPVQPSIRLGERPKKSKPTKQVPQRGNKPKRPYHVVEGVRGRANAEE